MLELAELAWLSTGAALAAGGVWLLWRGSRSDSARLLGLAGLFYGARYLTRLLPSGTDAEAAFAVLHAALAAAGGLTLLWLVLIAPRPATRQDAPALLAAAACAAAMATAVFFVLREVPHFGAPRFAWSVSGIASNVVLHSLEVFSLLFLSFRYGRLARVDPRAAQAARVMCAGVAIFATYTGSSPDLFVAARASGVAAFALAPVAAAAWLWHSARGADPRASRNMALFVLAVPLAARLAAYWPAAEGVGGAVARAVALAIFAYGVLEHQLAGNDVKARWTISRTTVAAVFVAVFFVASETAQEFFGETLGSAYVGILAAGLLVFGIAPLSRFADRLAERAVPQQDPPLPAGGRREATFRDAVRHTMRDRRPSREEEMFLARLADELGLAAARATQIRHEIELESERRAAAEARATEVA